MAFYLTVFVMFLSVFETVGKKFAVMFFCCRFINNNNYNESNLEHFRQTNDVNIPKIQININLFNKR